MGKKIYTIQEGGPLTRDDFRKAVEILKANNNPKDYEVMIMPGSPAKMRPPSTHKRVYKPGRKFQSMSSLSRWLDAGGWVFWGNRRRAFHPGWFMSLQFSVVFRAFMLGHIRKAVRI